MRSFIRSCGLWAIGLTLLLLATLPLVVRSASAAEEEGFRPIFDGKTLKGWDGDTRFWRVEDGAIVGQTTKEVPTKDNTFLIWRGGKPSDFELRLEFNLVVHNAAGKPQFGNSGVQFRSFEKPEEWGKWVVGGYQADMDSTHKFTGMIYGERARGMLAKPGEKAVIGKDHKAKVVGQVADPMEILASIRQDGWNEYVIIAKGNHLTLRLNGRVTFELTDNDPDPRWRRNDGIIALQIHAGDPMKISYRNIRLKEFKQAD
jgi:hypothetical protein